MPAGRVMFLVTILPGKLPSAVCMLGLGIQPDRRKAEHFPVPERLIALRDL